MKIKIVVALTAVCGILFGGFVSDVAAFKKFPHGGYLLEMRIDGTPWSTYVCERNGSAFGENFSSFDRTENVQRNCLLYTSGEPRSDGSFDVYLGSQTWLGRIIGRSSPVHVPSSSIRSIKQVSF